MDVARQLKSSMPHCAASLSKAEAQSRGGTKKPRGEPTGSNRSKDRRETMQSEGGLPELLQGQQPEGRLGRIGTTPDTRNVFAEPSVAVSVVRLKRTWSLSRTTAVSIG